MPLMGGNVLSEWTEGQRVGAAGKAMDKKDRILRASGALLRRTKVERKPARLPR